VEDLFIALVLGYSWSRLRKTDDKIYAVSNDFDLAVSADIKSMGDGFDWSYSGPSRDA
jgi:hypothetical protein